MLTRPPCLETILVREYRAAEHDLPHADLPAPFALTRAPTSLMGFHERVATRLKAFTILFRDESLMAPDPDAIAQTVIDAYNALPSKRKPQIRNDGSKEWTILSGIVLSKRTMPRSSMSRIAADSA